MKLVRHSLLPAAPGAQYELVSLHYGTPGVGPKVTIQASLHADEVPGMLVAHHLRQHFEQLEAQGQIRGEIILIPAANPIGMNQWMLRAAQGRFDFASGENFNRNYADLTSAVVQAVGDQLGADAEQNVRLIRGALRDAVAALPRTSMLEDMRRVLLGLAVDADIVLDLHCDGEAVLHFYTTTAGWPQAEMLARCIGAEIVLLADRSGGDPFDEACSMLWPQLAERLGPAKPVPQACMAATIELRGEADVTHAYAERDARGILDFLAARGVISTPPTTVPALRCEALPLAGSIPLIAPHGGVVAFARRPGEQVLKGDRIADLIDPITGATTFIDAPVDGLFFARDNRRYAVAGMSLGKVAGRDALRSGKLLSA